LSTLSIALFLLALALPAGHARVTTSVSPHGPLTVGDRFEMTLTVTSPAKAIVIGPLADSMGAFAVADEKRKTETRSGSDETTYRLALAGFKTGAHVVPPFHFLVRSGDRVDTLTSDTTSVTIASVLPAKMQDINGLAPPETFPNWWLWIVPFALALAAVLAWVGVRLYRHYRRRQELAAAPLPPWEEALEALDALPWREWIETGQFKRYYYALSEVLKHYIERRFEFDAAEQTTTEMLANMKLRKIPLRDDIARFFGRSDLVKYAKTVPSPDEAESAIEEVRGFVRKTKPEEPKAPAPATSAVAAPASWSA
jgi:hypothetical protein